ELAGEASHALNAAGTPVFLQGGSRTLELGQVIDQQSRATPGPLYWYEPKRPVLRSVYLAKQYMGGDVLTRPPSNRAVLVIGWESGTGRDGERSRMKAAAFAESILPLLPNFIPS